MRTENFTRYPVISQQDLEVMLESITEHDRPSPKEIWEYENLHHLLAEAGERHDYERAA